MFWRVTSHIFITTSLKQNYNKHKKDKHMDVPEKTEISPFPRQFHISFLKDWNKTELQSTILVSLNLH